MDFGNLEIVQKTFHRKKGAVRGQSYDGIKFRRFISNKAGEEGKKQETLTFSDKLFDYLQLDTYACTQANTPTGVFLMVVEDKDDVNPPAKFLRQSVNEDGSKQKKGKSFSNPILVAKLIESKLIDAESMENQFLNLEKEEVSNLPAHVKGVYRFVIDESVDEGEGDEDEKDVPQAEPQAATAPAQDDF